MTKFADQLLADLMSDHEATLRRTRLPAATAGHPAMRRRAWLAGGTTALAVAATASLAALGGSGAAAFAVTQNADGTVNVKVDQPSGVTGANAALHGLHIDAVAVPARPGCTPIRSLPAPPVKRTRPMQGAFTYGDNTFTVYQVPRGDLVVIGWEYLHGRFTFNAQLTAPPAPACVSIPGGMPVIPVEQARRPAAGSPRGQAPSPSRRPGTRPAA